MRPPEVTTNHSGQLWFNFEVEMAIFVPWEIDIHVLVIFTFLGKDQIIFVTKEDHEAPSNAELIAEDPDDPYEEQGQSKWEKKKNHQTDF